MRHFRQFLQRLDAATGSSSGREHAAQRRGGELAARIATGDTNAFEEFYDLYSSTIYGLLLKIVGDAPEASDLLQETFFQAWQSAARWDRSRGSELAWLITIARSRAIDRLRARQTRSTREEEASKEIYRDTSSVDRVSAEGDVVLKEMRDLVRDAMQELPPEQRRVIELAYFEGKSQSQIATELETPLGSVKTRVQLAMKKLRNRLTPILKL